MALFRVVAVAAVVVLLVSACRDDSRPATGPSEAEAVDPSPAKVLPTNGGFLPEVISRRVGETQIDSFTFTPLDGGGDGDEIEGSPWGVWFGDRNRLVEDPPTGDFAWDYCGQNDGGAGFGGFPSPSQCINAFLTPAQSFLYFDPPVRRVSFWYASDIGDGFRSEEDSIPDDAFYFHATNIFGLTVMFDSIYANQDPPNSWPNQPRDDWTQVTISAFGNLDRIDRIYFNGRMTIDDLVIVRAAPPPLECGEPVVRGTTATCKVLEQVDAIEAWHFDGQIPTGPAVQIDTPHTADTWSGRVALSGIVSVDVLTDDSLHTFQDSLIVRSRDLSDSLWVWDDGKWDYDPGGGKPCLDYAPYFYPAADTIPVAENSSAENCAIQTFTPQSNDIDLFHLTYAADSIWNGGPNHGLHFVKRAYYEMKHGSYYNPSTRPDTAGSAVTSGDNLKDCRAGKNVTSLSKNLHEFNLDCTKTPERNEFLAWWAAVENHEGYGTPGVGPANNGHQVQREIAAAIPANDPYRLAEPAVGQTSFQLKALLGTQVFGADEAIADSSASHVAVQGNWGTFDEEKGKWCGNIYAYWTDQTPAEYVRTYVCEKGD